MPGFTLGLQNETAGTANEVRRRQLTNADGEPSLTDCDYRLCCFLCLLQEYIVNITQPLGIFIEESPDKSGEFPPRRMTHQRPIPVGV